MGSCHSSFPSAGDELDLALTRNKSFKTVKARLRLVENVNDVLPISMLTPLELAIRKKKCSIVKLFLDSGADMEQRSSAEWTPLLRACKHGCLEAVKLLIERGADINTRNQDGETPVFLVTKNLCTCCLRVLLEARANPNTPTKDGNFPIHQAVNQSCTESVRMLLKHGADRTKTGKDGLTPIQKATNLSPPNPSLVNSLLNDYLDVWTGEEAPLEHVLEDEEKKNKLAHEVEQCIYCPITFEVMQDPVVAADGHTYERKAIEQWLRQKQESPVTRQPLRSSTLTPNLSIRHMINQYMYASISQ